MLRTMLVFTLRQSYNAYLPDACMYNTCCDLQVVTHSSIHINITDIDKPVLHLFEIRFQGTVHIQRAAAIAVLQL